MKKITIFTLLGLLLMASCTNDDSFDGSNTGVGRTGIRFRLKESGYAGDHGARVGSVSTGDYDKVFFHIADAEGDIVTAVRAAYDASTSEIYAEGLHEGDYTLVVLAIKGDETGDRITVNDISNIREEWLAFPPNLHKPLEAEYFYSLTPFEVRRTTSGDGEYISIDQDIVQDRIVGRMDFNFVYSNRYVENAVTERRIRLSEPRFRTSLNGDGTLGGISDGMMDDILAGENHSYLFMPIVEGTQVEGTIVHTTVDYLSEKNVLDFDFRQTEVMPNHIHTVEVPVKHPDDMSPLMYITRAAYDKGEHSIILSDSERKEVYTDKTQRSFTTSDPLQLSVGDDGRFHARFYSPIPLRDVTVRAKIPAVGNEYFDFAYFDSIPAFADFFEHTPLIERSSICRTESGKIISVPALTAADIQEADFKLVSSDPYFEKLTGIKHGWTIYWGLFNGDPDQENGGPVGNWMGIRPVHIRESVAFFLNFTYLIDMDDHERILHENLDKLYDDDGKPVTVERVLAQMRQARTIQVGLVWPGNGVAGLGSPMVFGAWQHAWFSHYTDRTQCSYMFHELGHVMGYGHSSSFTYGPWAEQLMNNFYVDNLFRMPVDSPDYLDSKSNPNIYK